MNKVLKTYYWYTLLMNNDQFLHFSLIGGRQFYAKENSIGHNTD